MIRRAIRTGRRTGRATGAVLALTFTAFVAVGAVLGVAAPAAAHAVLVQADPPDGTDLAEAPEQVQVTFNEPVQAGSDGLRVFDADATRVDTGAIDDGDGRTVAVGLPDGLAAGGYVVTYRVISEDSHPIAGVLTFTVGGGTAVDDAVIAELFGGARSTVTGVVGPLLRGAGYAATLLAAGAVAVAAVIARRDAHRTIARRVGVPAAIAGAVLAVLAVPVQGAAVSGVGVLEAATSTQVLGEVLNSGFGEGTVLRVLALAIVAAAWRRPTPGLFVGVAAGAALGSYLRDGHQRTVEPAWALVPGDAVHLAAGALWFAGLVLLALVLRTTPREEHPLPAAAFVARFSTAALWSVLALAVSGLAMAWPLVGSFGALTATTYGWTLLGKVAAVVAVVVIATYNRQRLVPLVVRAATPAGGSHEPDAERQASAPTQPTSAAAGTTADDVSAAPSDVRRHEPAWRALTTTVRLEALVLVGVLLVTGFLVSQPPAAEEAGLRGLYEMSATLGDDLEVDVVVDPNRVGRNAIHVYVVDPTGRPSDDVDDLVFELTYLPEGIGPIAIEPLFAGPGHWTANVDDLRFAGEWELRIVAGVDRFTEHTARVTIPVAR